MSFIPGQFAIYTGRDPLHDDAGTLHPKDDVVIKQISNYSSSRGWSGGRSVFVAKRYFAFAPEETPELWADALAFEPFFKEGDALFYLGGVSAFSHDDDRRPMESGERCIFGKYCGGHIGYKLTELKVEVWHNGRLYYVSQDALVKSNTMENAHTDVWDEL